MKTIRIALISLFVVMVLTVTTTVAQAVGDNVDFGNWNDIQITKSLTKKLELAGGFRFDTKDNFTQFAEQRIYAGVNIKPTKNVTVQPLIILLKNFSRAGAFHEVRYQTTVGYRLAHKKVNISPRLRMEFHDKRSGLKNDGRIVPIISFDKKISKNYSLFNTNEFWLPIGNSKDVAKDRKRLFFGVTRTINKNIAVDILYLYQRDEQVAPRNNHKFGFTWKFKI